MSVSVTVAQFEQACEDRDYTAQLWGVDDTVIGMLEPHDDVLVTVWNSSGDVVFEDIVQTRVLWDTLEYLAVLMNGGLL